VRRAALRVPYFIDSFLWTLAIGAVLMAAPFTITL